LSVDEQEAKDISRQSTQLLVSDHPFAVAHTVNMLNKVTAATAHCSASDQTPLQHVMMCSCSASTPQQYSCLPSKPSVDIGPLPAISNSNTFLRVQQATDELISRGPQQLPHFSARIASLAAYTKAHPETALVDPLDKVHQVSF